MFFFNSNHMYGVMMMSIGLMMCQPMRVNVQCYPLSCWAWIYSAFSNSVDPDQLASEANWSGSALFAIQYVNSYQQSGSRNLIGWQLEVSMASWFIQHEKG